MNLCKDVCSIICSEATDYFLLDLYFSNASLARIVVVRDREIGKKCKLVVLYLIYAFLESLEIIMKLGAGGGILRGLPQRHIKCIAVVKILLFHDSPVYCKSETKDAVVENQLVSNGGHPNN